MRLKIQIRLNRIEFSAKLLLLDDKYDRKAARGSASSNRL